MEWYEYDYKAWGNREWDRPIDVKLMREITEYFKIGRKCIISDCLAVPGGSKVLGIHNAYMWNGKHRVLYSYKTKDGSAPGTAILLWEDEDIEMPIVGNLIF